MPNRPPWLKELNNQAAPAPHTEPAAAPSPASDEHVEALPAYDAPPPLVFSNDAQMQQALEQDAAKLIGFGMDPISGQPLDSETVSHTALPFAFDAAAFAATVESADDKPIQFDSPATTEPRFNFSQPAIDKPIAPIAVPANWNQPAEPVVTDPVPVAAPWLAGMSTPDVIAFDNHIQAVLAVNPAHAAILLRLKGWRSPYVGLLDTPDKAEQHIKICYGRKEDLGGWEDKGQQVLKKAELMLNEELARQRQQTLKHEHREFVNAARKAWKDAIEERRTQLELADIKVSSLHEAFKLAKELTFEEWKVLNDWQSS